MTKIKNKLLIGFILFTVVFFSVFPTQALAQVDQSFVFDDNVIFDSDITSFDDSFNLRQSGQYTGIYNASYTFTNEIEGTSGLDIDWIDSITAGTNTSINSSYNSHSDILYFQNSGGGQIKNFINQTVGIVEFWSLNLISNDYFIRATSDALMEAIKIRFLTRTTLRLHYNDTFKTITVIENDWIHVKFEFNTISDTQSVWINNVLELDNVLFEDANDLDFMEIIAIFSTDSFEGIIDAIGYNFSQSFIEDFTYTFESLTPDIEFETNRPFENWIYTESGVNNPATIRDTNPLTDNYLQVHFKDGTSTLDHPIITTDNSLSLSFRSTSVSDIFQLTFKESGGIRFIIGTDNGFLSYFAGTFVPIVSINDNQWYNLTITWNVDTDTNDIFVNGTDFGTVPFFVVASLIDSVNMAHFGAGSERDFDFDNFELDVLLLNYTNSQNLIPFLSVSETLQEVDRYEFALASPNVFNQQQSDNPNGWTDVELLAGDKVNVDTEVDGSFDNFVLAITDLENDQRGLRKQNIGVEGIFINVSLGIIFIQMDTNNSDVFLFTAKSSDNTTVAQIRVANRSLFLIGGNGQIDTGIDLTAGTGTFVRNEFNMFINYELDQVFFLIIINETVQAYFNQPLIVDGKEGLNQVDILITSFTVDDNIGIVIDFIGLYSNGISQVGNNDFGVIETDINSDSWNFKNNNLVSVEGNGTIHLSVINNSYSYNHIEYKISDTSVYQNELKTINIYDSINITESDNPTLLITILGRFFEISLAKIDGVVLNESSNSYNLIFTHGSVDTNESFFSVVGNELQFTHIANDTNLEFIQAKFNIDDVSSNGLLVSFKSEITNNAFGFLRINFTDNSNLVQMSNIETTTRFILAQNLTIRDIIILVSDRDVNSISGLTSGSISEIQFLVAENISVSVLITSLIAMMIPLIMILIPSLAISKKFGDIFIIPLFLLMSIICVATGIIPLWLFFIIGLSLSVFLVKKDKGLN